MNMILDLNLKQFIFSPKKKKKIKTDIEVPENYKTYDPDRKKYACAYCGDKFPQKLVRAQHEKAEHVDSEGKLLEITCEICKEVLPSGVHFRRHSIDKHQKYNHTTHNKESFCCDECGKTFNVRIIKGSLFSKKFIQIFSWSDFSSICLSTACDWLA